MRETEDIHPVVKLWLREHGYTYEYEVWMPEDGRADFLAKHSDGHLLLIECKLDMRMHPRMSILQLLGYYHQLEGDIQPVIAVLENNINEKAINLCHKYKVGLILLPQADYEYIMTIKKDYAEDLTIFSELTRLWDIPRIPRQSQFELFGLIIDKANRRESAKGSKYTGYEIARLPPHEFIPACFAAYIILKYELYSYPRTIEDIREDIEDFCPVIAELRDELFNLFFPKNLL